MSPPETRRRPSPPVPIGVGRWPVAALSGLGALAWPFVAWNLAALCLNARSDFWAAWLFVLIPGAIVIEGLLLRLLHLTLTRKLPDA